jgi:hypothetical protein
LTAGGAYYVIGTSWVVIAAFYYFAGDKIGRMAKAENDGCLLGIMNIILTIVGGGAGLLLFRDHYPAFVGASMFGALLLPTAGTLFIINRMSKRR